MLGRPAQARVDALGRKLRIFILQEVSGLQKNLTVRSRVIDHLLALLGAAAMLIRQRNGLAR